MCMFSESYSAVFVHIPKVAGTSVKSCLRRHGFSGANINQVVPDDKAKLNEYYLTGASTRLKQGFDAGNFPTTWDSCFKFAFVRNPWDRMVSSWSWIKERTGCPYEFKKFVHEYPFGRIYWDWHTLPQHEHIYDESGEVLVDFVGRFERLEDDLNQISTRMGISAEVKMGHIHKTKHKPYTDYYDDDTQLAVGNLFSEDVAKFGYEFGEI